MFGEPRKRPRNLAKRRARRIEVGEARPSSVKSARQCSSCTMSKRRSLRSPERAARRKRPVSDISHSSSASTIKGVSTVAEEEKSRISSDCRRSDKKSASSRNVKQSASTLPITCTTSLSSIEKRSSPTYHVTSTRSRLRSVMRPLKRSETVSARTGTMDVPKRKRRKCADTSAISVVSPSISCIAACNRFVGLEPPSIFLLVSAPTGSVGVLSNRTAISVLRPHCEATCAERLGRSRGAHRPNTVAQPFLIERKFLTIRLLSEENIRTVFENSAIFLLKAPKVAEIPSCSCKRISRKTLDHISVREDRINPTIFGKRFSQS